MHSQRQSRRACAAHSAARAADPARAAGTTAARFAAPTRARTTRARTGAAGTCARASRTGARTAGTGRRSARSRACATRARARATRARARAARTSGARLTSAARHARRTRCSAGRRRRTRSRRACRGALAGVTDVTTLEADECKKGKRGRAECERHILGHSLIRLWRRGGSGCAKEVSSIRRVRRERVQTSRASRFAALRCARRGVHWRGRPRIGNRGILRRHRCAAPAPPSPPRSRPR